MASPSPGRRDGAATSRHRRKHSDAFFWDSVWRNRAGTCIGRRFGIKGHGQPLVGTTKSNGEGSRRTLSPSLERADACHQFRDRLHWYTNPRWAIVDFVPQFVESLLHNIKIEKLPKIGVGARQKQRAFCPLAIRVKEN